MAKLPEGYRITIIGSRAKGYYYKAGAKDIPDYDCPYVFANARSANWDARRYLRAAQAPQKVKP